MKCVDLTYFDIEFEDTNKKDQYLCLIQILKLLLASKGIDLECKNKIDKTNLYNKKNKKSKIAITNYRAILNT